MRDITGMVVPVSNADTRKVLPYLKRPGASGDRDGGELFL